MHVGQLRHELALIEAALESLVDLPHGVDSERVQENLDLLLILWLIEMGTQLINPSQHALFQWLVWFALAFAHAPP